MHRDYTRATEITIPALRDGDTFTITAIPSSNSVIVNGGTLDIVGPNRFSRWLDIRDSEDELAEFFKTISKDYDKDRVVQNLSINGLEDCSHLSPT